MDEENENVLDYEDNDLTCNICYAEFLDYDDLVIHKKQMHAPSLLLCQFCDDKHGDLDEYVMHVRDKHLVNLCVCEHCPRVFKDIDECMKHAHKHRTIDRNLLRCSQCQRTFENTADLEKHETTMHTDCREGILFVDSLPHLSAILNMNAIKFIRLMTSERSFTCNMCNTTLTSPTDYLEHIKREKCTSFACDSCSHVYKTKKGIFKHIRLHRKCQNIIDINLKETCPGCKGQYSITEYKKHIKKCVVLKCKKCDLFFDTMYDLSKHQSELHPLVISLHTCKFCNKEFVGTVALEKHINRSHKHQFKLYKYLCIECDAIFKHPKKLFAHFFVKHKQLEPYTCKICDKKFRIRKKFTLHIKLTHKSVGFVEFDENYHVFFSDKKSEKPFQPSQLLGVTENDGNSSENENDISEVTDKEQSGKTKTQKVTFRDTNISTHTYDEDSTNQNVRTVNVNSDFMDITETEGNQTEADTKIPKKKLKRKIKPKITISKKAKTKRVTGKSRKFDTETSDSDNEPLLLVKKRVQRMKLRPLANNSKKLSISRINRIRFTCKICKTYCFTFQNYHNHMATVHSNESGRCVKCSQTFKSKEKLSEHIAKKHSSSKLTETLKNILEKRKKGIKPGSDLSVSEKFRRTITKVCSEPVKESAKVKSVSNDLSVQKFIETFTPEITDTDKKEIKIESNISIKPVVGMSKPTFIKLQKFEQKPIANKKFKLAMPVKFTADLSEEHKVSIKIVQKETPKINFYDKASPLQEEVFFDDGNDHYEEVTDYKDDSDNKYDSIPEVAQEIMLEGTEEPQPIQSVNIPHKILLPKNISPSELKHMRIAHLQPEEPFYKIIKVKEILEGKKDDPPKINQPVQNKPKKLIKLPNGTKLVNVNPLAHLLKDNQVEKLIQTYKCKNKYYKPKENNFESAVVKALIKSEQPSYPRKSKKKTVIEQ